MRPIHEGIQDLLEKPLNKKELKSLKAKQNQKIIQNKYEFQSPKDKTLKEYFYNIKDIKKRNIIILLVLEDGSIQADIARCLKIFSSMISNIFRGVLVVSCYLSLKLKTSFFRNILSS